MAFKKMARHPYPPRLWALVGYPGSGKSTFAAQMRTPLLTVDADGRFQEVLQLAKGDVYELSDKPEDRVNPDRIAALLTANMPGADVATIVVDSLTAIMEPIVSQALVDRAEGRVKNLAAGWQKKALAMRQLQDAVTRWGADALWIFHLSDGRDAQGNPVTRETVSPTELARLTRSINLRLEVIIENARRGIRVKWARRGRADVTLWDDTGRWEGMPERIEAAVYDGLSEADQDRIEQEPPAVFASPELAWAWGHERGAFRDVAHARAAYEKLKREAQPRRAAEMRNVWVADVEARLARLEAGEEEE